MDIDTELARLAARARADAEECRAAAARVEALAAVRWSSLAAERFREQTARRARHLRALAADCESLADWLERLSGIVHHAQGAA